MLKARCKKEFKYQLSVHYKKKTGHNESFKNYKLIINQFTHPFLRIISTGINFDCVKMCPT